MWSLICLYLLVAAAGQVNGIELSLTAVDEIQTDNPPTCGQVRCKEEVDTFDDDSIKSLRIRKQLNGDVVLVELNRTKPRINSNVGGRYSERIWATGTWMSYRAEAELTLYNSQECKKAEFVCEIVHVNKLGVEHTSSHSGRISGKLTQHVKSSLANLGSTVNAILNKLPPTTCFNDPSLPQDKRYQVVFPLTGAPSYLCDTHGGWAVIQRRTSGKTDFYRNWSSYKNGFGSFDGDFWLGLDQIHEMTSTVDHELMVTMMYYGSPAFVIYFYFKVLGEEDKYKLSIGAYIGTAGDSLGFNNGMQFSTFDNDNDITGSTNCAQYNHGAWWYSNCSESTESNLNGKWGEYGHKGVTWYEFMKLQSVTMSSMMIRKMHQSSKGFDFGK